MGTMAQDIFPGTIPGLVQWGGTYAAGVAAAPALIGVPPTKATELTASFSNMTLAVGRGTDPATRTAVTISDMRAAIASFKTLARQVAKLVRAHPGITPAQLQAIGLRPAKVRQPIHAPAVPPLTTIVKRYGWVVEAECTDQTSGRRRAWPYGVESINVYTAVGQIPATTAGWKNEGNVGKNRFAVQFDPSLPPGTKVYICANWQISKGETSPACEPLETTIDGVGQQITPNTLKIAA